MYSYSIYSDQASINYYDVIIIIPTIVKVLQSSVYKCGVCVLFVSRPRVCLYVEIVRMVIASIVWVILARRARETH